jgi:hypothetical protein
MVTHVVRVSRRQVHPEIREQKRSGNLWLPDLVASAAVSRCSGSAWANFVLKAGTGEVMTTLHSVCRKDERRDDGRHHEDESQIPANEIDHDVTPVSRKLSSVRSLLRINATSNGPSGPLPKTH